MKIKDVWAALLLCYEEPVRKKYIAREIYLLVGTYIASIVAWAVMFTLLPDTFKYVNISITLISFYVLARFMYYWFVKPKLVRDYNFGMVDRHSEEKPVPKHTNTKKIYDMSDKEIRFELRRYFECPIDEEDIAREIFILINAYVAATLIFTWMLIAPANINVFFSIFALVFSLYILVRVAYYWIAKSNLTESQVDEILENDFERINRWSEKKLNLQHLGDTDDRPLRILNTFTVRGLIIDEITKQPRYDVPKKEKRDKTYHFAANRIIVFKLTRLLFGVYICDLNSLEIPKTAIIHEEMFECYLGDIDSFHVTIHNHFIDYKLRMFSDKKFKEIFEKLDSDSEEIDETDSDDDLFNNLINQVSLSKEEIEALQQLRRLKRTYKRKNFVIQNFLLQTIGGTVTGVQIGKLQNIDSSGQVTTDQIDDDIRAIQEFLRSRKQLGIDSESPLYTNAS